MSYPENMQFNLPAFDNGSVKRKNRTYASNGSSFTQGQDLKLSLPQIARTFASDVKVCGKMTITHSGTINTDKSNIIGGAYALLRDYVLRANNSIVVDELYNMNVLSHHVINMSYTLDDKSTQFQMLTSEESPEKNLGEEVFSAANRNNLVFDFCISVPGFISDTKMIPLHGCTFDMNFIIEDIANIFVASTANGSVTNMTLTDMRLEYTTLQLSIEGFNAWMGQNTDGGIITMHTSQWLYNTSVLPASTQGNIQIPVGSRAGSIRGVLMACVPANINCGKFASVLPNADQVSLLIGGSQYPAIPLDCINDPSLVYSELLFWHGGPFGNNGSCIKRKNFLKGSTATGRLTAYVTNDVANYSTFGTEMGLIYIDLEKHDGSSIVSGINNQGTSTSIQLNIPTALSAQVHTLYAFFYVNASIIVDFNTGIIERRI